MTAWKLTLEGREEVADGTLSFRFAKPAGFAFKAGQAIDLIIPGDGPGAPEERHAFSLVGAPFEDGLTVATRMRDSAFKRALGKLPVGGHAACEGPFGSLTLHRDTSRDAALIAGGIGITPFMSILRQALRDPPTRRLALVYSNRRPEDAAFLDELERLERSSARFKLIATMTDMSRLETPLARRDGPGGRGHGRQGPRGLPESRVLRRGAAGHGRCDPRGAGGGRGRRRRRPRRGLLRLLRGSARGG